MKAHPHLQLCAASLSPQREHSVRRVARALIRQVDDGNFTREQVQRILHVYRVVLPAYGVVCAISATTLWHHDFLLASTWACQGLAALVGSCLLLRLPDSAQRTMQVTFATLVAGFLVRVWHATAFSAGADLNLQSVTAPLVAGAVVAHTLFPNHAAQRFNKVFAALATSVAFAGLLIRASIQLEHVLSVARFALCAFGMTSLTKFMSALQREHAQLKSDHAATEKLALTDLLTDLPNRRACHLALEREMARAQRHGDTLSVLVIDVDKFKTINDRFGHETGDAVLYRVAGVLREQLRSSDEPARWGGDEFLVVLPSTPLEGALIVAERLRAGVARSASVGVGGVTISVGVAMFESGKDDLGQLVRRADQALYRAKTLGRNRAASAGVGQSN